VTSSMDWLPRRQAIRSRLFGLPAPIASTGISAKMAGINMLTSFVIAVTDPNEKKVLVPGPRYAMDKISAVVQAGPLAFISGVRGTLNPINKSSVDEETSQSFAAQSRVCYEQIKAILADIGLDAGSLLRMDCYLRDGNRAGENAKICREILGAVQCASTTVALPFSGRGEIEVTTLAAVPAVKKQVIVDNEPGLPTVVGADGMLFVGECLGNGRRNANDADPDLLGNRGGQLNRALDVLEKALKRGGSTLARTVRLELWLRDIYFADDACVILRRRFGDNPPVVAIMGAELEDLLEVKLNAIAV
jgi:enamine deaminase RidA (YjgF/YER057c/UK114 family)